MGCLWCGKYRRHCKTMPSGPPEFIPPFIPVTGMKCSYGKISSPLTEISVGKTEISGTEPARPLIWTHRKFYKGFRGEARSRKRGQPGQPGSYEEALKRRASTSLEPGSAFGGEGWGWGEGEEEEKNGRKSNRGASREVIWGGEIEGYPGTRLDVDFICA